MNGFHKFCKKIADGMGLVLIDEYHGNPIYDRHVKSMKSLRDGTVFHIHMDASDLTAHGVEGARQFFLCEFYNDYGGYLGAICQDGESDFEHYEVAVSPTGHYLPKNGNPCDKDGNEIEGEIWVFCETKKLGCAINSFKKGGSRDGRKPIKRW